MFDQLSLSSAYVLIPGLIVLATPFALRLAFSSSSTTAAAAVAAASTMAPTTPQHTVVVLGAGYVGVPMAHHLLKHTPPSINLRVVLVAPNDAMYWVSATPRGFLPVEGGHDADGTDHPKGNPGLPDKKLFYPLAPAFAQYSKAGRFEQVLGRAQRLDPDQHTVEVRLLGDGNATAATTTTTTTTTTTVRYDTLLIATGSDFAGRMPFKILPDGGTAETQAALAAYRQRIGAAKSIVVAGGGMTGVELAAELGHAYGKQAGGTNHKDVTLIVREARPLQRYGGRESVGATVAARLAKLGVRVLTNTVATVQAVDAATGRTVLALESSSSSNGTKKGDKKTTTKTLETDVYLPAFGVTPSAQFVPAHMLDTSEANKGRVRTRPTLQAEGYDDIFVAGDVANLEAPSIKNAEAQIHVLAKQLQTYLKNWQAKQAAGGGAKTAGEQPLATYTVDPKLVMAVSLGPGGGTGQMGSFTLWSWLVWMLKARYLGTDYAGDYVAGRRTVMDKKW
ncbi:Pyridine nucleotide-disulfide oxidoreductase, NAD-binding domain protein [Niveomyces insectorum RCEF 264]|uniref:Pyridine nucleotide-disulfide oxidoreductase, NAD-binding domain protein n=1 Tax=Niveomyces insectorum RCEF 264 TaxID=1081102 RepID=A0A167TDC1_9HYPO|nr:Pyridine nucleotide-disulfide oxidoreductase, NAD-binding domain protein [Niveomyces insectorum RCEF 264]